MSTFLNWPPDPPQPADSTSRTTTSTNSERITARLEEHVVIKQERGEQGRKIDDRIAEGATGERIAVGDVQPDRVGDEDRVQREGRAEVEPAAHPVRERQERGGEQHQRIQQHVQLRELAP